MNEPTDQQWKHRLGKAFKLARVRRDMLQVHAAEATGISQTSISEIENGRSMFGTRKMMVLAEAYGTTVSAILQDAGL